MVKYKNLFSYCSCLRTSVRLGSTEIQFDGNSTESQAIFLPFDDFLQKIEFKIHQRKESGGTIRKRDAFKDFVANRNLEQLHNLSPFKNSSSNDLTIETKEMIQIPISKIRFSSGRLLV